MASPLFYENQIITKFELRNWHFEKHLARISTAMSAAISLPPSAQKPIKIDDIFGSPVSLMGKGRDLLYASGIINKSTKKCGMFFVAYPVFD